MIIIPVLFAQCNRIPNHKDKIRFTKSQPTPVTNSMKPVLFYGDWICGGFIYSSGLSINTDGTFKYFFQGCTGSGISEGTWKEIGGSLIFSSYDKYKKETEPVIIYSEPEPVVQVVENEIENSDSFKYTKITLADYNLDLEKFNTVFEGPVAAKWPDTTKVYFDHDVYKMVGDTLYGIDKITGIATKSKFWRPGSIPLFLYDDLLLNK